MTHKKIIHSVFGKGRWLFLLMIILLLVSLLYEKRTEVSFYTKSDVEDFQKTLNQKEKRIGEVLDLLENDYCSPGSDGLFANVPSYIYRLYQDEGLAVFVYRDDSLCFWTDNSVPVPEIAENIPESTIDHLGNSIFLKKERILPVKDTLRFVGLVLIKTEYPYENRFLRNGFQSAFSFTSAVRIRNSMPRIKNPVPGQGYPVYDDSGQYLFSIDPDSANRSRETQMVLCLVLYLFTFFIFLMFIRQFIRNAPYRLRNYLTLITVPVLYFFYYLLAHYRLPSAVFDLELFSSDLFARSAILAIPGRFVCPDAYQLFLSFIFFIWNFISGCQPIKNSVSLFLCWLSWPGFWP